MAEPVMPLSVLSVVGVVGPLVVGVSVVGPAVAPVLAVTVLLPVPVATSVVALPLSPQAARRTVASKGRRRVGRRMGAILEGEGPTLAVRMAWECLFIRGPARGCC
ncbi:MAG: hypothetical protein JNK56_38900, partial [Myxococcales bacterium]|nr:hypothetical protein [Myxococcales bacterium]